MTDLIGGPDRDRTDDLFHAMVSTKSQIIDGIVLTSWQNRQKLAKLALFAAKMLPNFTQRAKGLIVWISPISSSLYLIELQAAETRCSAM